MHSPIMIICCGLQCSGKSTLSTELSERLGISRVCTDDIRKRHCDNPGIINTNPLERHHVYRLTLKQAEEHLMEGRSVIIDGTFALRIFRKAAYHTAEKNSAQPYLIHCFCNNYGMIKERYRKRQEQKKNNTHLFDEWTTPQPFYKLFQEYQNPDREALPCGEPIPIIKYDTQHNKAWIEYSDGSKTINEILEAIKQPERN